MDNANTNFTLGEKPLMEFTWVDSGVFSSILVLSVAIGIYFGCFGSKQKSKSEYLLGGKTMQVIPIAVSLIASDISGIALLAVPAEIYNYGGNYIWGALSTILACIATAYIYLPVFHKLQLTSTFEYLNIRFDNKIRILASLLYTISMVLYNSIVIYIPALALEQSTGISVHLVSPLVCATCIFYTTIGGLKAVVWTDALQMVSMVASMAMVFILGMISSGGIRNIIDVSSKGHRLDIFDLNVDPTIRDGICAIIIGATANNLNNMSISQAPVQRYLSLPTIADARKAIAIFAVGVAMIKVFSVFTGLIMYTKYANCDPLSSGVVTHADQILPYYIMDVAGNIPGLPGIFIAGIFSASLSTLSAVLNTLAATLYEDFIVPLLPNSLSEKQTSKILKLITVIMGSICTALVFLVEKMGGILPLANSFTAITGGPLAGLFTLGMLFPTANAKGALYGTLSGLAFLTWIVVGNLWCRTQDYCLDSVKPTSIESCLYVNITENSQPTDQELPFYLYQVSYWYYTFIGMAITISIGLVVSWFTRNSYPPVHHDLISPFVLNMMKSKEKSGKRKDGYLIELKALNTADNNKL